MIFIKRLEDIKETWKSENTWDLDNEDVEWLIEQVQVKNDGFLSTIQETVELCKVIASMKSEIEYALLTNKSIDVREHYLKNAVRYANEVLNE